MGSQRFCLRWNNHQSNLLSVFDQLLHDEAFVDVTLAVEGQFLKAHKMVLSACSPYFQALFVGHPDKHPIVILKDVPYTDMRSLLDFMYRGEVSVDQDRLTAFLKVAESLRIKGLTEVNEERCDLPTIANSLLNQSLPPPPPPPNLHRIQQVPPPPHPPMPMQGMPPNKRPHPHHFAPNPMLNNALTAPKRKRGRPRKLSGSSPGTPNCEMESEEPKINNMDNHLGGMMGEHLVVKPVAPSALPKQLSVLNANPPPAMCSPHSGDHSSPLPEMSPAAVPHAGDTSEPQSPVDETLKADDRDDLDDGDAEGDIEEASPDGEHETDEYNHVKMETDPKPSTSGQENMSPYQQQQQQHTQQQQPQTPQHQPNSTPDGERYPPTEATCLQAVSVSICEDVSITPAPSFIKMEMSPSSEDVVITPLRSDDESLPPLNPAQFAPGVHFLTSDYGDDDVTETSEAEDSTESAAAPGRRDLLEYLINEDGSVVCKWCGELLPSRTHWYRHKYKFHTSNPLGTASLFKCYKCNLFFKSRKGYLGHVSTRHSRSEQKVIIEKDEFKPFRRGRRTSEDFQGNPEEYEKQREKEEKLVADIIDRVKRECEAQGNTVSRKGYSRRSTIMNT